jgi:hypothetical protein
MYALQQDGQVTANITSVIIMQQNRDRMIASVVNDSLLDIWLGLGPVAVANKGITLKAGGGSFVFGRMTDFPWCGQVSVVSTAAANVVFTES